LLAQEVARVAGVAVDDHRLPLAVAAAVAVLNRTGPGVRADRLALPKG